MLGNKKKKKPDPTPISEPQKAELPALRKLVYTYVPKKDDGAYKSHLKPVFLREFQNHVTILKTCEIVGVDRGTVYKWRKNDKEFNQAFIDIDSNVTENIERKAIAMALAGDPTLIIFLLKSRDRRYRSRTIHEVNINFMETFVNNVVQIIQTDVPSLCPHCHKLIDFKDRIKTRFKALSTSYINKGEEDSDDGRDS